MARRKHLKSRPNAHVGRVIPPPPRHRRKFLSVPEWKKLYKAACDRGILEKTVLYMMYRFGLRAGEVPQLKLENLQALERGMIYIPREKGGAAGWQEDLDQRDKTVLKAWLRHIYPRGTHPQASNWLFPSRRRYKGVSVDRPLSRYAVSRIVRTCASDAGLPVELAHPHAIRHGLIMHGVEKGLARGLHPMEIVTTLAKRVGHTTAETTVKHYISETQGAKKALTDLTHDMLEED